MRRFLTGKPIWLWENIHGANGLFISVHFFNDNHYLLKQMGLVPYIFLKHISLVGISIRNSETVLSADHPLWKEKPGMFNLWFIRNSLKIAYDGRDAVDLEYVKKRSFKYNLLIILKTFPALLYHQDFFDDVKRVNLLDIDFYNVEMQEAVEMIENSIESKEKTNVFFINADCLNKTVTDLEYAHILSKADMVFPDGSGINLACKMIGRPLRANVNGTDMFPWLCELAQEKGYGIYFLGAKPGIVEKMRNLILVKYPKLLIVGLRDGYFNKNTHSQEIVKDINDSKAVMLFVAFGAPIQEKWIYQYASELHTYVNLGVGGLFDFFSDTIPRAPHWMRELGCEWVYRLMQEPKRMWKRYIIGNPLFLFRVFRWKKRRLER